MVGKLLLSTKAILSGGGVRSENRGGTRGRGEWQSNKGWLVSWSGTCGCVWKG